MKKSFLLLVSVLITFSVFGQNDSQPPVRHYIDAVVDPGTSTISVIDSIVYAKAMDFVFDLNKNLNILSHSGNVELTQLESSVTEEDVGMDRDDAQGETGVLVNRWKVHFLSHPESFTVQYQGRIDSLLRQSKADYQRGFTESAGIINLKGCYLAGSTFWVPTVKDRLVVFRLRSRLPSEWYSVSQGERISSVDQKDSHIDVWSCTKPQEEIFLIGAKFTLYGFDMYNGVKAMAFLRTPDESLATKYLEATERYMKMYESMLGPYPYSKFALVENFWETGYGMPSFTLLGEKIIRFPFILYSSYPHELLHNWWGNSVYVDFNGGNWCEGITAYMADHLMKEQNQRGEEYRRSTLQKFSDFVNSDNDFPLSKFSSRYNATTEAIGYGKALMMWHMVRRKLGDKLFLKGMKHFYEQNKFKKASYDDIRRALEDVSGINLKLFFQQWVNRTGAPELNIKKVDVQRLNGKYRIDLTLQQVQPQKAFVLDIPIGIATQNGDLFQTVHMTMKEETYHLETDSKPLKLAVDPQFDVFRRLNPDEVPPALSKALAAKENLIVLPSAASPKQAELYRAFVKQWMAADNDQYEVVTDKNLKSLPKGKTVWILGNRNLFVPVINRRLTQYQSKITADSVVLEGKPYSIENRDFVINVRNNENRNLTRVFISIHNKQSVEGLVRKLPHYGKYCYLGFEGDEPVNMAKGSWPVLNSPLVKIFDPAGAKRTLKQERKPLAEKQTVFSQKRMMETIKFLSSDELKGRGLGTPELDKVAAFIAGKFKEAGLKPLGKDYFLEFDHTFKDKGKLHLKNVAGYIPGTDPKLKDQPVVVSAHYDHLGLGWPDVHKGDEGKIHHGADDNASGVSILIELARTMGKTLRPKRPVVFVAFTGEEAGLIGSRHFVKEIGKYFKGEVMADVNLDTDGRLFDGKLLVLNGNSAKEWKFIFMGTDYTTGVKSSVVLKQLDSSDQLAFIEKGIPGVQLFTGATADYHRPTDTWDKIDPKGLVKVATVAKEVVAYLADREEPLHFTGEKGTERKKATAKPAGPRRASTGSIPDFAYTGQGVMIGMVMPGSAGEKAGLKKGDVIVALNGTPVNDLRAYSDELKKYQPGDKVVLTVERDGKRKNITLVLGER